MGVPLRVLFFGGGQDSTALLYKYYYDLAFRQHYAQGCHFIVVMANTDNEYLNTYQHVAQVMIWCKQMGIEFYLLTADMGYHGQTWPSLWEQMERNSNVFGVAFPKTCTDNLKIKPCYRFLGDYLRANYHYTAPGYKVFYEYKHYFDRLVTWIGFAAGEEKRVAVPPVVNGSATYQAGEQTGVFGKLHPPDEGPSFIPRWRKRCITHVYPLIDEGLNRLGCQQLIAGYGHPVPYPSNCMMCPFQGEIEVVYLNRLFPRMWDYWVSREKAKLEKFAHRPSNLGVMGKLTLPAYLDKARKKYGDWSTARLEEHRFSHGHCVMSRI